MGDAAQQAPTGTPAPTTAASIYDTTIDTAFSLAFRITGDRPSADAACEAAYSEILGNAGGVAAWDRSRELALLAQVRSHALELRPGPASTDALAAAYLREEAVRGRFARTDPVGRRAVELCYFGGMTADEVAGDLGMAPAEVRAAMRRVLLALGASAREEGNGR